MDKVGIREKKRLNEHDRVTRWLVVVGSGKWDGILTAMTTIAQNLLTTFGQEDSALGKVFECLTFTADLQILRQIKPPNIPKPAIMLFVYFRLLRSRSGFCSNSK